MAHSREVVCDDRGCRLVDYNGPTTSPLYSNNSPYTVPLHKGVDTKAGKPRKKKPSRHPVGKKKSKNIPKKKPKKKTKKRKNGKKR